jgi:hypothetical protein
MLFRTAGILLAHLHDASWKPAVRMTKIMSGPEARAPLSDSKFPQREAVAIV